MSKHMVLVYENGVAMEKHIVETPEVTEPGFYRQIVSLSAFSNREGKRLHTQHKKGILDVKGKRCWVRWYDEFVRDMEIHQEVCDKLGIFFDHQFSGKPEFHHTSVWDFYKAVGYDYKKKKYLQEGVV